MSEPIEEKEQIEERLSHIIGEFDVYKKKETSKVDPFKALKDKVKQGLPQQTPQTSLPNKDDSQKQPVSVPKTPSESTTSSPKAGPKALSSKHDKEILQILERFEKIEKDLSDIEAGPKISRKEMDDYISNSTTHLEDIYNDFFETTSLKLNDIRSFVDKLLYMIGPNQDTSLLLTQLVEKRDSFLPGHSLNVCIFSIVIAIHISKLMQQKLGQTEVISDITKTRSCSLKSYNRNELLDLGTAAILHDLGTQLFFKNLNNERELDESEQLLYQKHVIEGYHYLKDLNYGLITTKPEDIYDAVRQHHERLDGSGYPDSVKSNLINRNAKIIAVADRFDLLSYKNPIEYSVGPAGAILMMFSDEKDQYDLDVLLSLLKVTSIYPLGTFLLLDSGDIAIVTSINRQQIKKPIITLFQSNHKQWIDPVKIVDLATDQLNIAKIISPIEYKIPIHDVRRLIIG